MKILFINTFYHPDVKGGAEVSIKKLAEGLVENKHEVYVLCIGEEGEVSINGVNVVRVNLRSNNNVTCSKIMKPINRIKYIRDGSNEKKLTDIIKKVNPQIIHTNNLFVFSTVVWDIANKLRIPVVHTLRDYALMCPKNTLLKKDEICLKEHLLCKVYRSMIRKTTTKVNYVTAPSNFTLNIFKETDFFQDVDGTCIYNAIDEFTNDIEVLKNIKIDRKNDKTTKFCFLGTLHEYKGIRVLIETFKKIKSDNVELHIVGDGILEGYVIKESENDKRIKYYGRLKENEMNNIIIQCDVMVVPSLWNEPFGRVVIDAYKFGLPVIGFKVGGLSEIIYPETGMLVEAGDKNQLYNSMIEFMDKERVYNCLNDVFNKTKDFSLSKQINNFEEVYDKVLGVKNKQISIK